MILCFINILIVITKNESGSFAVNFLKNVAAVKKQFFKQMDVFIKYRVVCRTDCDERNYDNTRGRKSNFENKCSERRAFDNAKNHKRQRRKRQSVTAKREKSQTPKFV